MTAHPEKGLLFVRPGMEVDVADIPALQRIAEKLQPKKILPIHTLHPEDYAGLFNFPVEIAEDGQYTL